MKPVKNIAYLMLICVILSFSINLNAKTPVSMQERIEAGKELFKSKSCSYCHSVRGEGGSIGPDLSKWESMKSPVLWGAIMWNHVPEMIKVFKEKKIDYPLFEGDEIAYIFEYIHSQAKRMGGSIAFPGDAERGAFLFRYLGCNQCHSVRNKGGKIGPDLTDVASNVKSDNELTSLMITHAPYMSEHTELQDLYWPRLQGNEIAHLFAYFRSLAKK